MGKKKKRNKHSHTNRASRIPTTVQKLPEKETLLNANRNADDQAIFKKYNSNDKYQKRFCEIYDNYYKSETFKKLIDSINDDLMKYADGIVPDYAGYRLFIFSKYIKGT